MKKIASLLLILFIVKFSYCQTSFDSGSITLLDQTTQKVYIKNQSWGNTPLMIHYKVENTSQAEVLKIETEALSAFKIDDACHYERFAVRVSAQTLSDLIVDEEEKRYLSKSWLLKHINDGTHSLLSYVDGNLKLFFVKTSEGEIFQLEYSKLQVKENGELVIKENNRFKNQLAALFQLNQNEIASLKYLKYNEQDLKKFFINQFKKQDVTYKDWDNSKVEKSSHQLSVFGGLGYNSSNFIIQGPSTSVDFEKLNGMQVHVGIDYPILSMSKSWSAQATLSVNYLNKTIQLVDDEGKVYNADFNLHPIVLDIGICYNPYLTNKLSLFFAPELGLQFGTASTIFFEHKGTNDPRNFNVAPIAFSMSAKGGIKFQQIYIQYKYSYKPTLVVEYQAWGATESTSSIGIGYMMKYAK